MSLCSTLSIIRYVSKVSGAIQRKEQRSLSNTLVLQLFKREFSGHPGLRSVNLYIYIYIYIYYQHLHTSRMGHKVNSKRSLTGLNTEFSFSSIGCHIKVQELSLPYYLPIIRERMIGFMPLHGIFVLYEMQTIR